MENLGEILVWKTEQHGECLGVRIAGNSDMIDGTKRPLGGIAVHLYSTTIPAARQRLAGRKSW